MVDGLLSATIPVSVTMVDGLRVTIRTGLLQSKKQESKSLHRDA
jgi:hypothetical protein